MLASELDFWLQRLGAQSASVVSSVHLLDAFKRSWYTNRSGDVIFAVNYRNLHWTLLILRADAIIFYDPLSIDIVFYSCEFAEFLCENNLTRNLHQIHPASQGQDSELCGEFTIFFAFSFCVEGKTVVQIEQDLRNCEDKDAAVADWFHSVTLP
jgi:hypothetical protein